MDTLARSRLETIFAQHGLDEYRWIDPTAIIVAAWVRMKCVYGCESYGHKAGCPPANVPSVSECAEFVRCYSAGLVFHFAGRYPDESERERWLRERNAALLQAERGAFLAGYHKAFALLPSSCRLCADCQPTRTECEHPMQARPTAEAMAIDVYGTVRQWGLPIQVLGSEGDEMNRYGFLLLE